MLRTISVTRVAANESKVSAADNAAKPLTEAEAAQAMWVYYRDNKAQLSSNIRDFRDAILAGIMAGAPVAQVFAPFVKPIEPAKPARRAA
jgi:hypothetical protein